jgi:hypothetical protein
VIMSLRRTINLSLHLFSNLELNRNSYQSDLVELNKALTLLLYQQG